MQAERNTHQATLDLLSGANEEKVASCFGPARFLGEAARTKVIIDVSKYRHYVATTGEGSALEEVESIARSYRLIWYTNVSLRGDMSRACTQI